MTHPGSRPQITQQQPNARRTTKHHNRDHEHPPGTPYHPGSLRPLPDMETCPVKGDGLAPTCSMSGQESADSVQPGDRGAIGGAAERFEGVVPGGAEELVQLVGEGLRVAGSDRQGT